MGACDVGVGVLIDVFEVLGESEVGHADGLILDDDAVQKITQTIIRTLSHPDWSHKLFVIKKKNISRRVFTGT